MRVPYTKVKEWAAKTIASGAGLAHRWADAACVAPPPPELLAAPPLGRGTSRLPLGRFITALWHLTTRPSTAFLCLAPCLRRSQHFAEYVDWDTGAANSTQAGSGHKQGTREDTGFCECCAEIQVDAAVGKPGS